MRKMRDVFYVYADFDESSYIYYGMEFKEFILCCPVEIRNILVTDGNYITNSFNRTWFLETAVGREEILELSKEDLYGLGNFHWLDYDSEEDLDRCTPEEQAEVLYLSHFGKPLKSPFFSGMNNQFVYLAHDDGWFCKLYCREMSVFREILANKIIEGFKAVSRRKIAPMVESLKDQLLEMTREGLLVDFSHVYKDRKSLSLNFYTIGRFTDMDEMYNDLEKHKHRAEMRGYIQFAGGKWKCEVWSRQEK